MPERAGVKGTTINIGVLSRVAAGVRYAITGKEPEWFGPMQPIPPVAQDQAVGRQFDYPVAYNMWYIPKLGEGVQFNELRGIGDACDIVRLAVETRKDQIEKLKWSFRPRDPQVKPDERCKMLNDFFMMPDKRNSWKTWLRMLIEDVLVTDAPAVYPRMTVGNKIYAFEPLDGTTIKRVITADGRTPMAPDPAYQQILKGMPAVDYSVDELVYMPRNPRTHKVYGFSPVEQVIMTINIALRRQISQLQYFTEGNIPDMFSGTPDGWTPTQIKEYQQYWDSMHEGNTSARRKMKFLAGNKPTVTPVKEPDLKTEFDEWIARIVCYAFSLPPTPFIKQMNRATAESSQDAALEEGLSPLMEWVKTFVDYLVLKYFQITDLEFGWENVTDTDPLIQAQINDIYLKASVLHPDEVRADLGLDPLTEDQKSTMPTFAPVADPNDPNLTDQEENTDSKDKKDENLPDGKSADKLHKKKVSPPARGPYLVKAENAATKAITKTIKKNKPGIINRIVTAYGQTRKADGDDGDDFLDNLDLGDWSSLAPTMADILAAVAKKSGIGAVNHYGLKDVKPTITTLVNEDAVDFADERGAELVGMRYTDDGGLVENPDAEWAITDGTRELLRSDVAAAINDGLSTDDLAAMLEDNYAFSDTRAETISRTEIARAHTAGQMSAYDNAGVTKKEWLLSEDPCPICEENAADGVIDFDENFSSGDDAPPAHPNCECDVNPVLDDLEIDDSGDDDNGDNE